MYELIMNLCYSQILLIVCYLISFSHPQTTTTSTTTITTTPGCISSLGCYSDSNNRLLSYFPYSNSGNSITNCIETCIQAGYLYAGVEAYSACFCGNCLNLQYNSKVASNATCDQFTCPADNTQYCGGAWLITVYQLNCTNAVINCSSTTTSTTTTTTTTTNPYTPVTIGACETCEGGWSFLQATSSCYKYVSTPVNWTTAEYVCEMVGTNLVSIHSQTENNFVATLSGNTDIFIGLNHLSGQGTSPNCTFSWTDDSPVDFLYWYPGEPINAGVTSCVDPNGEQCVEIWNSKSNGQWNDINCRLARGFVCQYSVPMCTTTTTSTTTTTPTTTTTTTTNPYTPVTIGACETCEGGWSFLQATSSCYKVNKKTSQFL
uniref:C-type LECtin n=1 Tax=Acrobeloides nanus TaxID=290746 RepID=A0A914EHK0_9BILA